MFTQPQDCLCNGTAGPSPSASDGHQHPRQKSMFAAIAVLRHVASFRMRFLWLRGSDIRPSREHCRACLDHCYLRALALVLVHTLSCGCTSYSFILLQFWKDNVFGMASCWPSCKISMVLSSANSHYTKQSVHLPRKGRVITMPARPGDGTPASTV